MDTFWDTKECQSSFKNSLHYFPNIIILSFIRNFPHNLGASKIQGRSTEVSLREVVIGRKKDIVTKAVYHYNKDRKFALIRLASLTVKCLSSQTSHGQMKGKE